MASSDTPNQPTLKELTKNEDTTTATLPTYSPPEDPTPPTVPEAAFFSEQEPTSELVSKAQTFLEHSELKQNDPASKTEFLITKGVSSETADELQKALASIPVIPARTYPEALVSPPRSRLLDNLVTLYYFFTYAAGASALFTFIYSRLVLPRWSKMITAKTRLREHQIDLLRRLNDELSQHRKQSLSSALIAPTTDSQQPVLSTRLQEIRAQVPTTPPKTTRQHALQSLSNLTGYLSSQYHITSGLDSARRSYNFQFSMPGTTPNPDQDDVQDQIKKELRGLKGLLINRRTFLPSPMASRSASTQRMY